jgi:endo-1,4-beta-xylanase
MLLSRTLDLPGLSHPKFAGVLVALPALPVTSGGAYQNWSNQPMDVRMSQCVQRCTVRPLIRALSIAAALISVLALTLWPTAGFAAAPPTLRGLATGDHVQVGSAVTNDALTNDATYSTILAQQFNSVTPENEMKWASVEAQQGVFDYSRADAIVAFAQAHGQSVRGQTLVWHSQLPNWVTSGTFTSAQLADLLHKHITDEVTHFSGQISDWDVVTEPFNDDGTLRATIWEQALGPDYIAQVLVWAHEADPQANLYINDFNIEFAGPKADAMLALVKSLKANQVPINGVGFESHLGLQFGFPTNMQQNLARFAAVPVDIAISEADVRMILPATPDLLAQQASFFAQLMQGCLSLPQCRSFTLWEYTDKYSWVPGFFKGQGAATPWDENLQPKPAFTSLINALDTSAPKATPSQSPAANAAGWNNSDVTVNWNWADADGPTDIDSNNCTTSSTSSGEGPLTLSATCKDLAGNQGTASYRVNVDKSVPSITAAATAQPNSNSWYNGNVTVHFTCSDALSGVAPCPADQVLSTEGSAISSTAQTATDVAGNTASSNVVTVKIDKTPPTITAAATTQPNSNGWYNGNVTVHFTCSDALSGVASCPADQMLSAEGSAVSSTAESATDMAGNTASSSVVMVKIDKTAPAVTVAGVADKGSYLLGNVPTATCATADALSGVAAPAHIQITGGTPTGVGSFTATCSGATDNAGNTAAPVSATYSVNYSFSGFKAPVNNRNTVNTGKAGRAYPIKFQLTNASGGFISNLSAVKSITYQSTSCADFAGDLTDPLETTSTGNSGLQYDSTANQFIYVWATPSAPGCYTLFVTLDSGQAFTAYFNLS